ncbi:MAG: preprotein translocase subunit SecY [Candidatus Omnitrophica bacterium]|nr:preprotein translocase subunit SecY [Candidatus Omnitrophota bacterium]MCK4424011.1 preprotein translocase subunit SecY [Candidatus Omnitrophota bacterium]
MLKALGNIFKIPELKRKVLFTLGILVVYRLGGFIPTPGIDGHVLANLFKEVAKTQAGYFVGLFNMFSGGAMQKCTIFALGIMPYISASIIFQLLTAVIPSLEKIAKEGESGRRKINQYTRYATVGLCLIQSFFIAMALEHPERISSLFSGYVIVPDPGWFFRLTTVITMTTGSIFIMWLGEEITERGIGNGISLIITAGIVSRMPIAARDLYMMFSPAQAGMGQIGPLGLLLMAVMMVFVIVGVILVTQGQRKIPVQYAKRVVGRKVYGMQSSFIPLRINLSGVIPIIFAQSVIMFPATIAGLVPNPAIQAIGQWLMPGKILYTLLYSGMIIFFCYFYTAIVFNPVEVADNMKKYGGFVPGVRPGKQTADYFFYILNRITLAGAIFLALIAIFPNMVSIRLKIPFSIAQFFGGTGLLIIVGVVLDTMKQIESQLLMRHYEGFMKKSKLKGRR